MIYYKHMLYLKYFLITLLSLGVAAGGSYALAVNLPQEPIQNKSLSDFTPSPGEKVEPTIDSVENVNTQPITQVKNEPQPTIDPDPIVTCTSKTGNLQVRSSVCKSNTDCPDGYGGYVFESQSSCQARWSRISNMAKDAATAYGTAVAQSYQASSPNNTPMTQVVIPTPVQFKPQVGLTIKDIPNPTIAPQGQGSMNYAGY